MNWRRKSDKKVAYYSGQCVGECGFSRYRACWNDSEGPSFGGWLRVVHFAVDCRLSDIILYTTGSVPNKVAKKRLSRHIRDELYARDVRNCDRGIYKWDI